MNDLQAKLIDALRSGEWLQNKSSCLKNGLGYCPLGVAVELYMGENRPNWEWRQTSPDDHTYSIMNGDERVCDHMPPDEVLTSLGLNTWIQYSRENLDVDYTGQIFYQHRYNKFPQIAQYLEEIWQEEVPAEQADEVSDNKMGELALV